MSRRRSPRSRSPVRPARDRLVEPHTLDKRHVLDQAEQRRLRGHELTTSLLFGQTVERVMQNHSVSSIRSSTRWRSSADQWRSSGCGTASLYNPIARRTRRFPAGGRPLCGRTCQLFAGSAGNHRHQRLRKRRVLTQAGERSSTPRTLRKFVIASGARIECVGYGCTDGCLRSWMPVTRISSSRSASGVSGSTV